MPTVYRSHGLRVVVYPNDHRPAHVHVIGAEGEAVFILNCPDGPATLRECHGFSSTALRRLADMLNRVVLELCDEWEAIHGAH